MLKTLDILSLVGMVLGLNLLFSFSSLNTPNGSIIFFFFSVFLSWFVVKLIFNKNTQNKLQNENLDLEIKDIFSKIILSFVTFLCILIFWIFTIDGNHAVSVLIEGWILVVIFIFLFLQYKLYLNLKKEFPNNKILDEVTLINKILVPLYSLFIFVNILAFLFDNTRDGGFLVVGIPIMIFCFLSLFMIARLFSFLIIYRRLKNTQQALVK